MKAKTRRALAWLSGCVLIANRRGRNSRASITNALISLYLLQLIHKLWLIIIFNLILTDRRLLFVFRIRLRVKSKMACFTPLAWDDIAWIVPRLQRWIFLILRRLKLVRVCVHFQTFAYIGTLTRLPSWLLMHWLLSRILVYLINKPGVSCRFTWCCKNGFIVPHHDLIVSDVIEAFFVVSLSGIFLVRLSLNHLWRERLRLFFIHQ